MIHVACPCGKEADVRDDLAGKKVRCTGCKQLLTVPGPEQPLLLDDPPTPPKIDAPKPAPPPVVESPPEPAVEKAAPWKTIAMAASGVAALALVLAAVGFMREGKTSVQGDPRDRDDLLRLRQSLNERDREIQTLKEIALKGEDPAKFQAFTKQIDDLRADREKALAAAADAQTKIKWLEDRVRTLEGAAAAAPKIEAPTAVAGPAPAKTESLPDIVQKCLPAVVVIKTDLGSGAGFFVADDGTLLTNYHVIANSKGITVDYLFEGARRNGDARVRAVDPDNDLALVHVNPAGRVAFLSVEKAAPRVGESVVAIGSPGIGGGAVLGSSVSTGIVSSDVREIEGRRFLQTTAPINPGNSGGPLLSSDGRLYGVVTAKAVGKEGIGFAVPADIARAFLDRRDEAAFKVEGSLADWESRRGHAIRTSHSIDKAVPLALPPMRLHVEDDRDRLLALTPGDNSLHVLSISERKVLKSVPTGSEPADWAVLPGGRTVWVANFGSKNLVKIDTERGAVVETLPLTVQPIKITYAKSQIWMLAAGQPYLTIYSFNDKKEYVLVGVPAGPTTYDGRRDRIILGIRQGLIEFDPGRLLTLCKEMIRTRGFPNEQAAIKQELEKTLKGYPVSTMSELENREMLAHEKAGKLFYDRTILRLDKLDSQLGTLKPNPYSYSSNAQVRAFIDRFRHLDQIMAVSPDGKWAANGTHVYEVERFTVSNELPLPSPSVGFTRDSKTVWLFDFVNKALIPFPVEATAGKKDK
ncbi:MAG TPA: trypsin-like peptidase domain-containing protein [Planctomycetota bacterium]|nr:trypsin-like peptidase domain-containing protein [Planctomycetota bacterium]